MLPSGRPIWANGLPYWWTTNHWSARHRDPPSVKPYNTALAALHYGRKVWNWIGRQPMRRYGLETVIA